MNIHNWLKIKIMLKTAENLYGIDILCISTKICFKNVLKYNFIGKNVSTYKPDKSSKGQ